MRMMANNYNSIKTAKKKKLLFELVIVEFYFIKIMDLGNLCRVSLKKMYMLKNILNVITSIATHLH